MKVYIVMHWNYSDSDIRCVCSTEERAKQYMWDQLKAHTFKDQEMTEDDFEHWNELSIEPFEVLE